MPKPFFKVNHNKKLQEIIRVNHAGEFGAKVIYEGQIDYIKNAKDKDLLKHMLEQEQVHLKYFQEKIQLAESRPTVVMPIWNILGYYIGAFSAKCGINAAMLVTKNIEEVIENHYQEQIDYLRKKDHKNPLLKNIQKFKDDEVEHKNLAIDFEKNNLNNANLATKFFEHALKTFCRLAILISKKI